MSPMDACDIREIRAPAQKTAIARAVLEALPDWFAIPASREAYIADSAEQPFFAALDGDRAIGFLCLKETSADTAEIAVMGVLKACHRQGVGRRLFARARDAAVARGYSFLQVKTVQAGLYKEYDTTNRFYRALGFRALEVFPTLWDARNPCQVCVLALPRASDAEADVLSVVRAYQACIRSQDEAAFRALWAKDAVCGLISVGNAFVGVDAICSEFLIGRIRKAFSRIELIADDIAVRFAGDRLAVVVFRYHTECVLRETGAPHGIAGLETQVIVRESDGWKLLQVHYSKV